jgi:hypothetical protein
VDGRSILRHSDTITFVDEVYKDSVRHTARSAPETPGAMMRMLTGILR